MRIIKRIFLATAALLIFTAIFLIGHAIMLSRPTHGDKIARYENPQKAVLVIDIQEDFTGTTARPPFPYKDSRKLIDTVNAIAEVAQQKNVPVVYIRQELDGFIGRLLSHLFAGGTAIKGNPGTRIDKRVHLVSHHLFPKPKSDAFSNPDLGKFLIERQISEVYLIGLDADGCVHNTALGALNRGYTVHIITDAILLLEEQKWERLLQQYRKENLQLMTTKELFSALH